MSGVTGQQRLQQIAVKLPGLVDRELREQLRDGFKGPVKDFKTAVDREIRVVMPGRYAGVFGRSFRIVQSGTGLDLKLRGTAKGKASKRDSLALDHGVLKHPVYGRYRRTRHGRKRNPWSTQQITPGFWSRPGDRLIADLRRKLEPIAEKAAKRIEAKL